MRVILFYNKFIICLYMFRALCAHHQEFKIVLYGIKIILYSIKIVLYSIKNCIIQHLVSSHLQMLHNTVLNSL